MRHLLLALCLAAAGCAGQQVPTVDQPTAAEETSPLAVVAQGACIAGIVAVSVVLMNPGGVGGLSLCN